MAPASSVFQSPRDKRDAECEALCALARECARRGWLPATSGNFSLRHSGGELSISASGIDKGDLTPADLLRVDADGRVVSGKGRPSAETDLHRVIYRRFPEATSISHVHTIANTLLSQRHAGSGAVVLEGFELLKALSGVETHAHREVVPVLANSQDYALLASRLDTVLESNPNAHGVLLSAHGLYTWGSSVAETRRHLEALEFLFEVEERRAGAR